MHPVVLLLDGLLDHVDAEVVGLVRPVVQLGFPVSLLVGHELGPLDRRSVAGQGSISQSVGESNGSRTGVAADPDRDLLDQTEHLVVGIDLDDLGVLGPIVHVVLGQGAERAEAGSQRQDDVGLGDQLHGSLGALVAQRAAPLRMAGRERVVVQVTVHHRAAQALCQSNGLGHGVAHDHAAARHHHRELRSSEHVGCSVQAVVASGATIEHHWLSDLHVDVAVEAVAGDVQLGGTDLRHGPVEAAGGDLGHTILIGNVTLVLDELLEHRELVGLLEAS